MDRDILDFRGQLCPLPVIGLKKALEGGLGACTVLVDTEEAVENLTRLVHHFGRSLDVEARGDEWILTVGASAAADGQHATGAAEGQKASGAAEGQKASGAAAGKEGLSAAATEGDANAQGSAAPQTLTGVNAVATGASNGAQGLSALEFTAPGRILLVAKDGLGAEGEGDLSKQLMKTFFFSLTEIEEKPKAIVALNRGVLLLAEGSPVADTVAELQEQGIAFEACGLCLQYFEKKPLANVAVTNMYAIGTKLLTEDVVTLP